MLTYDFDCALPALEDEIDVRFVRNPAVRGSLQIVWICFTTLFVCVYQVLKLNLPDPRDTHRYSTTIRVLKTLGLALLVLLAPEVALTESLFELGDAYKKRKLLNEASQDSKHQWSLIQTFYVNMGGFVVMQKDGNLAPVDGATLATLIKRGNISAKPPLTNEEIMDKSKDDAFSKIVAVGQILYFSIDFLARVIQSTPTSQLELGVASTALCSVMSYILGWWKPKSIETATVIELRKASPDVTGDSQNRTHEPLEVAALLERVPPRRFKSSGPDVRDLVRQGSFSSIKLEKLGSYLRILRSAENQNFPMLVCCLILSIPPGAIHVAGWNFAFPTAVDTWLWRSSSIASTGVGPAILFIYLFVALLNDVKDTISVYIRAVIVILGLTYAAARVIIVVLMIRLLFYLPADGFQATSWSMSIPHIG